MTSPKPLKERKDFWKEFWLEVDHGDRTKLWDKFNSFLDSHLKDLVRGIVPESKRGMNGFGEQWENCREEMISRAKEMGIEI